MKKIIKNCFLFFQYVIEYKLSVKDCIEMSNSKTVNIVLLGDVGTGKTQFCELLSTHKFNKIYDNTNRAKYNKFNIITNKFDVNMVIWDIPVNNHGNIIFQKLVNNKNIDVVLVFKIYPCDYQIIQSKIDTIKKYIPNILIIDIWNMSDLPEQQRFFQQNSQNYIEVHRPYLLHTNTEYQNAITVLHTILSKLFDCSITITSICE